MNVEPMKITVEVTRVPDGQLSSRPLWKGPCPACAKDGNCHSSMYTKLGMNPPKCHRMPHGCIVEVVEKNKAVNEIK